MGRTDTASHRVAAPPDRVFAAPVAKDALVSWLPPAGMSGHFEAFDLRPGGSYRLVLTYDDPTQGGKTGEGSDMVEVHVRDVVAGERVVQAVDFPSTDPAFAGTMTMTWSLTAEDGGTRVTIVAEDVPAGISAADHEAGLASSLAQLAAYVEG